MPFTMVRIISSRSVPRKGITGPRGMVLSLVIHPAKWLLKGWLVCCDISIAVCVLFHNNLAYPFSLYKVLPESICIPLSVKRLNIFQNFLPDCSFSFVNWLSVICGINVFLFFSVGGSLYVRWILTTIKCVSELLFPFLY